MASPYVSFVVHKTDEGIKTYNLMVGPFMNNSHASINAHFGLDDRKALRVEIHKSHLQSGTECVPWTIDTLPDGARFIEDVDADIIAEAERAAAAFMTPDNVINYLNYNPDAYYLAEALFTSPYLAKVREATQKHPNHAQGADSQPSRLARMLASQRAREVSSIAYVTKPPTCRNLPRFTLADLLNTKVWKELP